MTISNARSRWLVFCLYAFIAVSPVELYAVNPIEFGLQTAKNGKERFWALYNAHLSAQETGETISYANVGDIDIEIPDNAQSIPVVWNTDFCGITITVKNKAKDFTLFSYRGIKKPIAVAKSDLDGHSFTKYENLKYGTIVLILKDDLPWVENRKGFDYGANRSDVRLLINGKAQNDVIMPYDNLQSSPSVMFAISDSKRKELGNLKFVRTLDCDYITRLFDIDTINNFFLHNVTVITPSDSEMNGDAVISISNSTNVTLSDIIIDGTYSHVNKYGYGVSLSNVWNVKCNNVKGDAEWGIFCCNNINKSFLKNCDINRYDCHCYGRDITAEDCVFHDLSNQISSVYGTITFNRCEFHDFIPIYLRDDYNSYVPFDVCFSKCKFYATKKAHSLIYMGGLYMEENKRPELTNKCWPNVKIRDIEIISEDGIDEVSLFDVNASIPKNYTVGYMSRIDARRVSIRGDKVIFEISHHPIQTQNKVLCIFRQRGSHAKVNKGNIRALKG